MLIKCTQLVLSLTDMLTNKYYYPLNKGEFISKKQEGRVDILILFRIVFPIHYYSTVAREKRHLVELGRSYIMQKKRVDLLH